MASIMAVGPRSTLETKACIAEIDLVLAAGADIELAGKYGFTALHYAAQCLPGLPRGRRQEVARLGRYVVDGAPRTMAAI